jgi:hypothetical protein
METPELNSKKMSTTREATNCAATPELPSILWYPEVHYISHKSPSLVPILSQTNAFYTTPCYISIINLNIINHLHLGLPNGLFPSSFPMNNLYVFPLSLYLSTCSVNLILLFFIILILLSKEYKL